MKILAGARHAAVLVLAAATAACSTGPVTRYNGAYRAADGTLVAVTASGEDTVRYIRYDNGESRRLVPLGDGRFESRVPAKIKGVPQRSAVFGDDESLVLTQAEGGAVALQRLALPERPAEFASEGVTLRGSLVLPATAGPHPAVILVHGSGDTAALPYYPERYFFAANGIATLVFDKRGTGTSGGDFGMDFALLARDVVAGVEWLKRQPDVDGQRIGLSGYSQGGWIAPLAASLSPDVRFVLVNYGMIESPAIEEIEETVDTLRQRGASESDLAEARELLAPAMTILGSHFADGWDAFDAAAARYAGRAWMEKLDETTLGAFLRYPHFAIKAFGPWRMPEGLDRSWHHDSGAVLDALDIPMAWLLGGADREAPNAQTIVRLHAYHERGKPFELTVFENTDHGMAQFQLVDGRRVYANYAPGYFRAMVGSARRFARLD
jgi:uncharacterized protein